MDDEVKDFADNGHLFICPASDPRWRCTRDCHVRLYLLAERLEGLLKPDLDHERATTETPFFKPPVCPNHNETQKRDGKAPWCSWCGWRHARPAVAAEKVGPSAEEKSAGAKHQPWSPELGYAEEGRRLASEREDLIAKGIDPALLDVPLHPNDGYTNPQDH